MVWGKQQHWDHIFLTNPRKTEIPISVLVITGRKVSKEFRNRHTTDKLNFSVGGRVLNPPVLKTNPANEGPDELHIALTTNHTVYFSPSLF